MANSDMIHSLIKALDILSTVARASCGIRLNELADTLGLKKTTVHNLIRTLRARNYLVKDGTNRFHLGSAVPQLLYAQHNREIVRQAEAGLLTLHQEYPAATLIFSEDCDGEIFCRLRMSSDQPAFIQRPLAQTLPPYTTASSLAMMAFQMDYGSSIESRFPFDTYGLPRWNSREALEAELEAIRCRRYAFLVHDNHSVSLAVTVGDRFILGIHLPQDHHDIPPIAASLQQAALNILKSKNIFQI